jgi:hypothetical protein
MLVRNRDGDVQSLFLHPFLYSRHARMGRVCLEQEESGERKEAR